MKLSMLTYVNLLVVVTIIGMVIFLLVSVAHASCYEVTKLRFTPSSEGIVSYVVPTQLVRVQVLQVWPPLMRPVWVYVRILPIVPSLGGEGWLEVR